MNDENPKKITKKIKVKFSWKTHVPAIYHKDEGYYGEEVANEILSMDFDSIEKFEIIDFKEEN